LLPPAVLLDSFTFLTTHSASVWKSKEILHWSIQRKCQSGRSLASVR